MELHLWLSLVVICFLGALSPGPSLAVVIKSTLNGGQKQGYACAISHGFGVTLYAILTVAGIGLLIVKSPLIFNTIKYAGAVFLLYLGIKSLLAKVQENTEITKDTVPASNVNGWRDGFLIAFLNPKLAIFFIALFSQFIDPNAGWQQKAIMAATVGIMDTAWYLLVAYAISRGPILEKLNNNTSLINKLTGSFLIVLAIRVVVT